MAKDKKKKGDTEVKQYGRNYSFSRKAIKRRIKKRGGGQQK